VASARCTAHRVIVAGDVGWQARRRNHSPRRCVRGVVFIAACAALVVLLAVAPHVTKTCSRTLGGCFSLVALAAVATGFCAPQCAAWSLGRIIATFVVQASSSGHCRRSAQDRDRNDARPKSARRNDVEKRPGPVERLHCRPARCATMCSCFGSGSPIAASPEIRRVAHQASRAGDRDAMLPA